MSENEWKPPRMSENVSKRRKMKNVKKTPKHIWLNQKKANIDNVVILNPNPNQNPNPTKMITRLQNEPY